MAVKAGTQQMIARQMATLQRASSARMATPMVAERVRMVEYTTEQERLLRALQMTDMTAITAPGYPYDSYARWIEAQRLVDQVIRTETAIAAAEQFADQVAYDQDILIERVWRLTTFSELAQKGLAAGATFAAAGAALGSVVPGVGTVIGAAVGFIVGVIYTVFPIEQWNVLNTWSEIMKGLTPAERYVVWKATRKVMDAARKKTSPNEAPLLKWEAKKPVFYTIWTPDGVVVFEWEELARLDSFPWSNQPVPNNPWFEFENWDPVAKYAIAALCGFCKGVDDSEKVADCYAVNYIRNEGKGSQWLKPYLDSAAQANATVKQVREAVTAAGFPDYDTQPYPPHVIDTLYQRDAERRAQLAMVQG